MNVGHVAGDVGAAGDGDEPHLAGVLAQEPVEVRLVEGPGGVGADVPDLGAGAPGQVVALVLDERDEHDVAGRERQPVGGLVDRLGGVLAEDHDVVAGVAADEAAHGVARRLVGLGRDAALVAGAAVHRGVLVTTLKYVMIADMPAAVARSVNESIIHIRHAFDQATFAACVAVDPKTLRG